MEDRFPSLLGLRRTALQGLLDHQKVIRDATLLQNCSGTQMLNMSSVQACCERCLR